MWSAKLQMLITYDPYGRYETREVAEHWKREVYRAQLSSVLFLPAWGEHAGRSVLIFPGKQ